MPGATVIRGEQTNVPSALLGPATIRDLAGRFGVRPTKTLGQNFMHDGGTVRKIVRAAGIRPGQRVLEVGPGLGSLTLGLLEAGASVIALEIDDVLAALLPETVHARVPDAHLDIVHADALHVTELPGEPPTSLVANLPYNVAVPVLLHLLPQFPSIETALVLVQKEVADRIAARPGTKEYGVPTAKVAWYARAERSLPVSRQVFWPVPNVDSALVSLVRRDPPATSARREDVFAVIDAAFGQRRKTLRTSLAGLFGSTAGAEAALRAAGIEPGLRGERLDVEQFARIAEQLPESSRGLDTRPSGAHSHSGSPTIRETNHWGEADGSGEPRGLPVSVCAPAGRHAPLERTRPTEARTRPTRQP